MQSSSSSQRLKNSMQRLLNGLQQTLQVFRVYIDDGPESENADEEPSNQKRGIKRKWIPREKELANIDLDYRPSRMLPEELSSSTQGFQPTCGPSSIKPSYIELPFGNTTSFVEHELYSTVTYEEGSPFKNKKCCTNESDIRDLASSRLEHDVEEIDLGDIIMVRCGHDDRNKSSKTRGRPWGDSRKRGRYQHVKGPGGRGRRQREGEDRYDRGRSSSGGRRPEEEEEPVGCLNSLSPWLHTGHIPERARKRRERITAGRYNQRQPPKRPGEERQDGRFQEVKVQGRSDQDFDHIESHRSTESRPYGEEPAGGPYGEKSPEEGSEGRSGYPDLSEWQVDFVLVYKRDRDQEVGEQLEYFLESLEMEGLMLESVASRHYKRTTFIKVYIPLPALLRLAKIHKISLDYQNPHYVFEKSALPLPPLSFLMDTILTRPSTKSRIFRRNRESVSGAQPSKPTSAERTMVIYEVLKTAKFGYASDEYGLRELIKRDILVAAYPVHDGQWKWSKKNRLNDRQLLKRYWGNMCQIHKRQPIQLIKKYFGPEIGFYFALMSFYIQMLFPAAIGGVVIVFIGIGYILDPKFQKKINTIEEICGKGMFMCPACKNPLICHYSILNGSCEYSKLDYLFDNNVTMIYGMIMSFWGTIFMVLWRRKEKLLKVMWNIYGQVIDTTIRPDYQRRATNWQTSPIITGEEEPVTPNYEKCATLTLSLATILLVILAKLIVLFGLILYRIAATNYFSTHIEITLDVKEGTKMEAILRGNASIYSAITASLISCIFIVMLDSISGDISNWLTNMENPRTQAEYDQSYLLKLFVLSFVNNYTIAFYLAFFRGRYFTHPNDIEMWDYLYGINADICDPSGCLLDLCIFISVLVIVKGLVNFIVGILYPFLVIYVRMPSNPFTKPPQWELDYRLSHLSNQHFTKLFVEMVIQYGFVVCFTAVFPLAALILLIFIILETRINAMTLARVFRRPLPKQRGWEMWSKLLYITTLIGIVTNAFVIGFTSDYVQRERFKTYHNQNLSGYVNWTLSEFSTKDFNLTREELIETCYYPGQRYPPKEKEQKYLHTREYFYGLSTRFVTTVIIIIAVAVFAAILFSTVSDLPDSIRAKINYQERMYHEKQQNEQINKK